MAIPLLPLSTAIAVATLLLGGIVRTPAGRTQPSRFVVTATDDGVDARPGDGICATADGRCTLRAAVMEANARPGADAIELPPGDIHLEIAGAMEDAAARGDLDVTGDLEITGRFAEHTAIDAGGLDRVFEVFAPARLRIAGVTLRGGQGGPEGGAIRNEGGTLTLVRVRVFDSAAAWGGGIHNTGALTMSGSTVAGNTAVGFGGGIANDGEGTAEVRASLIEWNNAGFGGGGIAAFGQGEVRVGAGTLAYNRADGSGGGLYVSAGAHAGLRSSTLSGNRAGQQGGAVRALGRLSIAGSTLLGNEAAMGGGISVDAAGEVTLAASVLVSGAGGHCAGPPIRSGGGNLVGAGRCLTADPTDRAGLEPLLGPLQDNGGDTPTHRPRRGSPAIDALDPAMCEPVDQRGTLRPAGARCDIGAVEATPIDLRDPKRTVSRSATPDAACTSPLLDVRELLLDDDGRAVVEEDGSPRWQPAVADAADGSARHLTSAYVLAAEAATDTAGVPVLRIHFTDDGAAMMRAISTRDLGRALGVFVRDRPIAALVVTAPIGRVAVLTQLSEGEVARLAGELNAEDGVCVE